MSQRTLANNDGAESAAVQAEEVIDYKSNGTTKPPYSYATLICMAMKANKNKMTLNSIYKWIRENFLYYQNADPSWQVCFPITAPRLSLELRTIAFAVRNVCRQSSHSCQVREAGKERK